MVMLPGKYNNEVCMGTQFRVQKDVVRQKFSLWVIDIHQSQAACATNITFERLEKGGLLPKPLLELDSDDVQMLMDELWNAGVRPTEQGTAGQLSAVKFHLEDMRKLVFIGRGINHET